METKVKEKTGKTIKEWLQMLPEEFEGKQLRKLALDNSEESGSLYEYEPDIIQAVYNAFLWTANNGGIDYWSGVIRKLKLNLITLSEPKQDIFETTKQQIERWTVVTESSESGEMHMVTKEETNTPYLDSIAVFHNLKSYSNEKREKLAKAISLFVNSLNQ